jgi:hypothetical protein
MKCHCYINYDHFVQNINNGNARVIVHYVDKLIYQPINQPYMISDVLERNSMLISTFLRYNHERVLDFASLHCSLIPPRILEIGQRWHVKNRLNDDKVPGILNVQIWGFRGTASSIYRIDFHE